MVSDGSFPDLGNSAGAKRGAPRANDGLLRLDVEGKVVFASPNGLSAFSKLGIEGELEGSILAEPVANLVKVQQTVDESLPLVITGKAPWRLDIESGNSTISLRSIPLKRAGERTGALILCRDVTDLRRSEQELITKDATIREIHHRVKNNLQTVASLLRMQGRRSKSDAVKLALEQAMRRVQAIATVHDTLSGGLAQNLNFDEVFDRILQAATELAQTHQVSVRTIKDGKFGQLSANQATPLAVVLTELVANAVEHGFSGQAGVIHVVAERAQKKLVISVSDNGSGLDEGKVGNGLGTTIIKTLVEGELKGTINWFSPKEGGAKATLNIPV
jgi:two-component sensor histidine kinase